MGALGAVRRPMPPCTSPTAAPGVDTGTVLGMSLNRPQGVLVDNQGNITVVEPRGTVFAFSPKWVAFVAVLPCVALSIGSFGARTPG